MIQNSTVLRGDRQLACFVTAVVAVALGWMGCGGFAPTKSDEPGAQIVMALTNVPADVSCIEITVTGSHTATQLFDVTPGQTATITLGGLPVGSATVDERAFSVPCSQVMVDTTRPTWVAEVPVTVQLVPGTTTDVTIILRRAGQVRIINDFRDGVSISPAAQGFGSVVVGQTTTFDLLITNGGTVGVPFSAGLTGTDASQFALIGGSCGPVATLAPGASCTLQARFAPTSPGAKSATLNVGGAPPLATAALSGTGVAATPVVTISPAAQAFGNVVVGQTTTFDLLVTNNGSAGVPFSAGLSGTDASQFALIGGSCGPVATLAPGASCTLQARFAPTSPGAKSATLNVGGAPPLATAALSGTGVAATPVVTISPAAQAFGSVVVGQTTTFDLLVSNNGSAGVPFSAGLSGTDASQFALIGGSCGPIATLAPGASCTLQARFAPTSPGVKSAALNVGGAPPVATAALSGTGVAATPVVTISPAAQAFGSVVVGQTTTFDLLVSNNGSAGVPFSAGLSGTGASQFSLFGGTCGSLATLGPGVTCTLQVRFAPTSPGAKSATLNVGGSPPLATAALSGVGVAAITFSPAALSLGSVPVGQNTTATITVTNNGAAGVPFSSSVTGTNAGQFVRTGGSCGSVATLGPGASCTFQIRFAPVSMGSKSASLNIGSPIIANAGLTGTGT